MEDRASALAFARTIAPGITDAELYRIHDCWGGYWQISVDLPGLGRVPYQFGAPVSAALSPGNSSTAPGAPGAAR
ncbi:hypothetical protein [Falsiroseomonas tokyonensis]|uniref:Uncharacterized protein n=1 Tax=Falsiroseomonas tokyonensis TaxID=430521 RepID=A0ABV7BXI6_9PROT|nr:hypothetical protein [Falsiroseomonas tokyonensis]MBU8540171.1 hypothetical protein [Falsiroseomonas tokyonensis]